MLVDEVCYQCELVAITARKSGCHPNVIYSAIGAYSIGSLKLDLCSIIIFSFVKIIKTTHKTMISFFSLQRFNKDIKNPFAET